MQKFRFYSSQDYVGDSNQYVTMLYPFWGIHPQSPPDIIHTFQQFIDEGDKYLALASFDDADYIVAPAPWEDTAKPQTLQLAERATQEKPIIIFFWHDSDEPVNIPNSIVFRTSFYKSTQHQNEYAMPAWSKDFTGDNLTLREKCDIPTVGFCGYALTRQADLIQYAKDIVRVIKDGIKQTQVKRHRRSYHVLRAKVLQRLRQDQRIKTNFIIRKKFYGNVADPLQAKREYIDNIRNSDYVVCMRGSGNFSYRLYETLSAGRIPVFVDTDCVLPYDFEIDWSQFCVWVDISQIDQIGDKVAEFHRQLSPQEFIDLQRRCRQFWEDYLSSLGFFKQFYRHFAQD